MLPKERMLRALEHHEPDRVPIGEIAADWEITERVLGHPTYYRSKWREYVAEWEGKRDEIANSYRHDIVDLVRKLEWDFATVPPVPARGKTYRKPQMLGEYTWRDASGKVWRYSPQSGGHAMLMEAPAMNIEDIVVPDRFEIDESQLEAVSYTVKELGGTHLVVGRIPALSFPWQQTVGMEEFLTRMVTQPDFVRKAISAYRVQMVAWIEAMCDVGVDAILETADYCDNRGPMMGPRLFRQFILPTLHELCKVTHARGKYFIKHCDGNTWLILDDFVAAGVDAWQAIQPSIGMDLRLLKEKYSGKLCLFGGVDNYALTAGSPADVVEEVKYAIRYAAWGGGLVLTSANTLQPGVKYENYRAMLSAAREFGSYPISLAVAER
jgi:uroporphyrinogen decarboxylase